MAAIGLEVLMNNPAKLMLMCIAAAQLAGCATGLHRAIMQGDNEAVKRMIAQGADVNRYGSGASGGRDAPLYSAAVTGNHAAVRMLLAAGADPNEGYPLLGAAKNDYEDLVSLLIESGAKPDWVTLLHTVCAPKGHFTDPINEKIVTMLLEAGANPNGGTYPFLSGRHTPLSCAVKSGSEALVRQLLKHGAEADPIAVQEASGPGRSNLKRLLDQSLAAAAAPPVPPTPVAAPAAAAFDEARMQRMIESAVKNASRVETRGTSPSSKAAETLVPGFRLAPRPRDFALVVGVDGYSSLPPARFAERDAAAFAEHMKALGLPERNIVRLSGSQASYTALKKYLESWLPKNVSPDSRVYVFFSGHGAPDTTTRDAYLVPWDGDPAFLEDTAYPLKRLYQKLGALNAKEVVVAMDACFSGAGGRSVLPQGARPLVMKLNRAPIPPNLTVFAAASGDQITGTLEEQGHGAFTHYFLKGLSGGAKDASGAVTVQSLFDYLKPKVQDAARRQNRDQEPVLHGRGDRELVRF
jgi:hypothetical protein